MLRDGAHVATRDIGEVDETQLVSMMVGRDIAQLFPWEDIPIGRKVLEDAGLIETRIAGTSRPRRLNPEAVARLWDWLGQYRALWKTRYSQLDAVLSDKQKDEQP